MVLLSGSDTARSESKDIDFNFEERVEPDIEDKIELDHKLEIKFRIEVEEKTEIVWSSQNYVHYDSFYFAINFYLK